MTSYEYCCGWAQVGRVCQLIGLPEGYHAVPRGQAWEAQPVDGRNVAPGAPRGRAVPGRRDTTQTQACKIELLGRLRAVGRREVLRNLEK
jgi:hypothetical protein